MKNGLTLLRQRFDSMTAVEKKIAACILESPETVVNETISHLASRAGTSSGSITNFASTMGFKGFSDLKIQIAQSIRSSQTPSFDGVISTDDHACTATAEDIGPAVLDMQAFSSFLRQEK